MATEVARLTGTPLAFIGVSVFVMLWALGGFYFHFSEVWLLFINTVCTIVTTLVVFLIQNTQNRDTLALQLKLAELILVMEGAEPKMALAEDLSHEDLEAAEGEAAQAHTRGGITPVPDGAGGGETGRQVLSRRHARTSQACRQKPAPSAAAPALKKGDHVFLVDGSGYIFRAYHALPPLTRKSDGLQVNAVLGFCNMLWKLMRDMKPEERPTHLAVVFDKSEKTFRSEMYPEYKANRSAPPDDLIPQFALYPRGGARLRPAVPRAGRLRGRRPDRHLCAAGLRGRRHAPPSCRPTRT